MSDSLDREVAAALDGINLQDLDESGQMPTSSRGAKGGKEKLVPGTVTGISGDDVIVELGPTMQGVIKVMEFDEPPAVGQKFEFSLHGKEDDLWLLSRREAKALAAWNELEPGSHCKAQVTGVNTGGLELKVGPVPAFMPASQVALHRVEDLSQFINQTLTCEVLEVDPSKKRLLLSARRVLEAEREAARSETIGNITSGQKVTGKITRIESFGAFVDIGGGLEGLMHISNISRTRVENPNDVLQAGQQVEVMILEITEGGKRIGLGMKQLEPDPWDDVSARLAPNSIVQGKVVRLMDFGAFVEIEAGIEGLLHVSQLGSDRTARVRDAVKEGQELAVRILAVEPARQRISLSLLDERGAVIGSEDAVDGKVIDQVIEQNSGNQASTNLGNLFKRALSGD